MNRKHIEGRTTAQIDFFYTGSENSIRNS